MTRKRLKWAVAAAAVIGIGWLCLAAMHAQGGLRSLFSPVGVNRVPQRKRIEPVALNRIAQRLAPPVLNLPGKTPHLGKWRTERAFPKLTFHTPITMAHAPGTNRLFVFEKNGVIWSFENDEATAEKSVFLDLTAKFKQVRNVGPHGLAFHPEFSDANSPSRGYCYVYYKRDDSCAVLSRFTVPEGETAADLATELVLFEQPSDGNHDGGPLAFGPDGFLYVAVGDDQHDEHTQTIRESLYSGVLRIDVDCRGGTVSHAPPRHPLLGKTANYYIPNDNPFVGMPGVLEEFYALGLRCPHKMTIDSETGEIWAGEVGPTRYEEVNVITAGGNYQWPFLEGNTPSKEGHKQPASEDFVGVSAPPVYTYIHDECNNSVIGGYVYRGNQFPELRGRYIFSDNGSGRIWALTRGNKDAPPDVELLFDLPYESRFGVSGFGEDAAGELYVLVMQSTEEFKSGTILKLARNEPQAHGLPEKLSETGIFRNVVTLEPNEGIVPYAVNLPLFSDHAAKRRGRGTIHPHRRRFPLQLEPSPRHSAREAL